jgi:IS1 family transposase
MANVIAREQRIQVFHMLVEGCSLRSICRLTGVHRTTVMNLMLRAGEGARDLLDRTNRRISARHVQCDEIWTFCRKKQGKLTDDEKEQTNVGDIYVFTALDTDTKLLITYAIGKRNGETTDAFIDDLSGRIIVSGDVNLPMSAKPQISTDGWQSYPPAIRESFGSYVQYGTLIKNYQNPEVGRYQPPDLCDTTRNRIQGIDDLRTICTSHVERHNLTIRTFLKRFTRLSLGFSKKLQNLSASFAIYAAYYNLCWRPRMPGKSGRLRLTPALAAGVVDELWTIHRLYDEVMG